ncbi:MAG: GreA/GreB family elongation factor [Proteobacteria bacterium]|nr:GreA/GreB family elongation factor [Pseudomonadota bacterium]
MQTATPFHGERTLTDLDHVRLTKLQGRQSLPALDELLDLTDVVSPREVAADVVTMRSKLVIADARSGQHQTITLCYPADADAATGQVSVLSPVGLALIGTRVGATARWRTPGGEEGAAQVLDILYQPEASGDYTA